MKHLKTTTMLLVAICLGALVIYGWRGGQIEQPGENAQQGEAYADHIVINEIFDSADNRDEWWLELYNPTDNVIDTSRWVFWFGSIYGPIHLSIDNMLPGEYVVLCSSEETFMDLWTLPEGTRCVEIESFGMQGDWIRLDSGMYNRIETIDQVPQRGEFTEFPTLEPGHCWARYAGGYDTDNFANDFYDESSPTPGMQNSRTKELSFETISHMTFLSGYENHEYLVIENLEEWEKIWLLAQPWAALPEVDFSTHMVIATFMGGRATGGYTITIERIAEWENEIVVDVKEIYPGMVIVIEAFTFPHHIVKIERVQKSIVFEVQQFRVDESYDGFTYTLVGEHRVEAGSGPPEPSIKL